MSFQLRSLLWISSFLFLAGVACAQSTISGYVLDSAQIPVSNATVTFSNTGTNAIAGFSQTNRAGYFRLVVNSQTDSVTIRVNHIAYHAQAFVIKNRTDSMTFFMVSKTSVLQEVVVKNPPVFKINDTVNYNVKTFTSKQDKVIGDVIKKLPGIEMENGRIKYQGKPIQEYLINGLNLLDEKYQLANNNLPAEAVQNVQIIENHQPIKILDSLVFSDRASLNIQLKKFTTTGSGRVAAGYKPALWDVNLTPMVFNKNFQALNTFQANNVGNNVASDLYASTNTPGSIFITPADRALPRVDFLAVQGVSKPPFEKERWLNNNIALISSNIIKRLKAGTELKGNFSFYNDYTTEKGENLTRLYIPGQTVIVSEKVDNGTNTNDARAGFSVTKNVRNVYFKDDFKFGVQWKNNNGFILRNDTGNIIQRKQFKATNFSNQFSSITFLGKQLINFSSVMNYFQDPQQLIVLPGQFEPVLNNGAAYDRVKQNVRFSNFDMDNSVGLIKGIKKISLASKLGFKYQNQRMESDIATLYQNTEHKLENDFQNSLTFSSASIYYELLTQYKSARLRTEVSMPVQFREFRIHNENALRKTIFEPRLFTKYSLTPELNVSLSSRYNTQFGGITQLYGAYVLNAYNSLQRFNNRVPVSNVWENYLSFNYTNAAKSIFANIFFNKSTQWNNYLFGDNVDSKGAKTITLLDQKNNQQTTYVSGDIGKYASAIKTTFKLKATTSLSSFEQMINQQLSDIRQHEYDIGMNINNSSLNFINIGYDGTLRFINSESAGKDLTGITTQIHKINVGITPAKYQTLICKLDYYVNNINSQPHQTFIDLEYRFFVPGAKINLELKLNNLLNRNMFTSLYTSAYSFVETNFQLRPRQIIIGTWFKF